MKRIDFDSRPLDTLAYDQAPDLREFVADGVAWRMRAHAQHFPAHQPSLARHQEPVLPQDVARVRETMLAQAGEWRGIDEPQLDFLYEE